jgi:hypothetical protein
LETLETARRFLWQLLSLRGSLEWKQLGVFGGSLEILEAAWSFWRQFEDFRGSLEVKEAAWRFWRQLGDLKMQLRE